MKRNTYTSLFMVATVVTILNFSSCSEGKSDESGDKDEKEAKYSIGEKATIFGDWEVVRMEGMLISEGEYDYYSAEFEFDEDGDFEFQYGYTYEGEDPYWYTYKGEWEWVEEDKSLNIIFEGDAVMFEITELTDSKLNMIDDGGKEWELVRD